MKKISRIEIVNFQSHSYTDLYLNDGVNVIVGPSDSGKTAIIRAIKWALFNEPAGTSFIKRGTEETKVILYFSDHVIIERGRSKNKNYYILKKDNLEERFEGFGHNVPKDIEEASGIHKISINNQNLIISIADQLESPFLIAEAPSVKSTAIGVLAGTDIIDKASSNLSKEIYETKNSLKAQENLLAIQKEELKQYDYLKNEKVKLSKIKSIIQQTESLEEYLKNLLLFKERYFLIVEEIKKAEATIARLEMITKLERLLDNASPKSIQLKLFGKMAKDKGVIQKEEHRLLAIMNKTKNLQNAEDLFSTLERNLKNYNGLNHLKLSWSSISKNILETESLVNNVNVEKLEFYDHQITQIFSRYQRLDNLYKETNILLTRIKNGNNYLGRYKDLNRIDILAEKIEHRSAKLKEYLKLQKSCALARANERDSITDINSLNSSIRELILKYEDVLKNITECPYCKSRIDNKHRESIVKEMRDDYGL